MEGPRRIRSEEFGSLLKLMDTVFPGNRPAAETNSHIFTGADEDLKNHIVFVDNGAVVSHLGLFPREVCVGSVVIRAAGVGSVATDEKHRGRGMMREMFAMAMDAMRAENYDISILEGDRRRYANFGWERGGRRFTFDLNDRFLKGLSFAGFAARRYTGNASDTDVIRDMYERNYFKIRRSALYYERIFRQPRKETLLAEHNGVVSAYLTFVRQGGAGGDVAVIYEYGGDDDGLTFLLQQLFATATVVRATAVAPVICHERRDVFFECASRWHIENCRMIKIVNLKSLLSGYAEHMTFSRRRLKNAAEGEVTLELAETGESATVAVGDQVAVTEARTANVLRLGERDMVRLLFGLAKPTETFGTDEPFRILDAAFPLDCFVWLTDGV